MSQVFRESQPRISIAVLKKLARNIDDRIDVAFQDMIDAFTLFDRCP